MLRDVIPHDSITIQILLNLKTHTDMQSLIFKHLKKWIFLLVAHSTSLVL